MQFDIDASQPALETNTTSKRGSFHTVQSFDPVTDGWTNWQTESDAESTVHKRCSQMGLSYSSRVGIEKLSVCWVCLEIFSREM